MEQQKETTQDDARNMADGRQAREAKRRKWQAKQARLEEEQRRDSERQAWIKEHSHYCTQVTLDNVKSVKVKSTTCTSSSGAQVEELLRPYMDLKDAPSRIDDSSEDTLFIAEGTETVRLLIQQTERQDAVKVKSVFVKPASLFDPPVRLLTDVVRASERNAPTRRVSSDEKHRPPFHLLVATEQVMSEIAGFHIARGALACGVVPKRDEAWLHNFLASQKKDRIRLLALDGISDSANMGAMIRCAAAFGIDAMILSQDCCDAWYRRSVRVSMGHVFRVPIVRVNDLASTLRRLADKITSYAAVIDADAELVLEKINRGGVPRSWCCVMGNEGDGISKQVVDACTFRLRIDMAQGVDSLSVPIASGILLHGLKEREGT